MRSVFLIALALALSVPAAASMPNNTADFPPDGNLGSAVTALYGHDKPSVKQQVAALSKLCRSKRNRDKVRCEAAWQKINAAYAELQARKALAQ